MASFETLKPPSSHLIIFPGTHYRRLPTSNLRGSNIQCWWLKKRDCSLLYKRSNIKKNCVIPIPFRAHWRMKIWQLNINIFMLTILFVLFLSHLFACQSIDSLFSSFGWRWALLVETQASVVPKKRRLKNLSINFYIVKQM